MKYQYNERSQPESKVKAILIKCFLFLSLFGLIYEGYKFFQASSGNAARGPDKYCGNSTCYDLLNVERTATDDEIKKSFRLLARKYHPDKSSQPNAIEVFQFLNKAYQTLIDEKSRFIYDLYLNNPQQSEYSMQFQYYNHKYIQNPQIPVSAVFFGIVACISALQYVMRAQMYEKAIERIAESHDFKIKVNERCKNNKKEKQNVREQMISQIQIEGGLAKPTYKDIFAYKLLLSPWWFILWIKDWILWILNYWVLRKPYDQAASVYLTKKALSIPDRQWNNLAEDERISMVKKQLWIEENKQKFIYQKRREWLEQLRLNNPGKYNMVLKYWRQNNIKFQ